MLPEERKIHSKEDLNRFLDAEMIKYGKSYRVGILLPFREKNILAKHSRLLRKTEYHMNTKHKFRELFYHIRLNRLQNKFSIHIPLNCCDYGLMITHVGPVLMNKNVIVGKNCNIHINSGLVASGVNDNAPILGDGVIVGFGAVVIGGVKVADNVAIGANAVVIKDITEENVAVAGVPARVVSNNGRLNWAWE